MAIDKDTIEQTGNVLTKLTSSERGTFLAIMIVALLSIVWIVIFYVKSMDGLIDKYNETINQQQKEFLTALKEFSK
jgi:cell division protein FtsL